MARGDHSDGNACDPQAGHATPDWLWTVALILFMFVLLAYLGAL